jgi:hypothetical protein
LHAADPHLCDDVVGSRERLPAVGGQVDAERAAFLCHHAPRQLADDSELLLPLAYVDKPYLAERELLGASDQPLDYLGRVAAAASYHDDLCVRATAHL